MGRLQTLAPDRAGMSVLGGYPTLRMQQQVALARILNQAGECCLRMLGCSHHFRPRWIIENSSFVVLVIWVIGVSLGMKVRHCLSFRFAYQTLLDSPIVSTSRQTTVVKVAARIFDVAGVRVCIQFVELAAVVFRDLFRG